MRRTIVLALVISLLLLGLALPALAGGTAYCGSGGYGFTYSNAFADHTFGTSTVEDVNGTKGHGFFTGNQGWDVYNPNPPVENGWCVT